VANTEADWHAAPQYNFTERDMIAKKVQNMQTYRVMMIDGSPYSELVAANGKPLAPAQAAVEDRKLQREIANRQRQTPAVRRKRIAEYQRERRQDEVCCKR